MGTIARYLVPVDSKLPAAEYAEKARRVLVEMGVISEKPVSEDPEGFYNGKRSTEPFQIEPDDDEYGFDLGGVFGGPGFIIAPEEYVAGVFCPKCQAEITDQFAPLIRDKRGKRKEYDSSDLRISCPKCGAVHRLEEVKGESVAKFYV